MASRPQPPVERGAALRRLLDPNTVAVVGASEARPNAGVVAMLRGGPEVLFVHPRHVSLFGRPAFPSLEALERPIDAVLSLVGAASAAAVVAEAARTGAGGVVVIADGFDPGGPDQAALAAAAGDSLAVLGPNCNGFANLRSGAVLSAAPELGAAAGGIGVVTQSGGYLAPLVNGARARRVGLSVVVSTGNEMLIDAADCLDALVEDPHTRVIALVLETIRRPDAFCAAAARAHGAGKPVVVLKLGRSGGAKAIAQSHSGALAGDEAVYDAAFRQLGLIAARDAADLLDRAAMLEQLGPDRWVEIRGVAAMSTSGGIAALASDVCEQEGVPLPELATLREVLAAALAAAGGSDSVARSANPVDLTGFLGTRPEVLRDLLDRYLAQEEVGALLFAWLLDEGAGDWAAAVAEPLAQAAAASGKPVVLSSLEDGEIGSWAAEYRGRGLALGRGLRASVRGLDAVAGFARARRRPPWAPALMPERTVERPGAVVASDAGPILTFAATMELLRGFGIDVAPFRVLAEGETELRDGLPVGPLVAKLADVPHREELGAVIVGVAPGELTEAVVRLRAVAAERSLPAEVVIQPQLDRGAEAFLGVRAGTGFGPLVLCGIGGTRVELAGRVASRLAPLTGDDARDLVGELNPALTSGFRGAPAWPLDSLADAAGSLGRLALAASPWLASLDINPLLGADGRFVAVDALCVCNV